MDGDTATTHQDQISLYGLFGDSSTTLQGLNDHLSPSLLQQSPPCGSVIPGQTTAVKTTVVSPPKQSITNGIQHDGVLLSDLADRSPSAGSITVASLCNYVSYGNQRCTNLVTVKGRRYCHQHSEEPVSVVQKAIFKKPLSSINLKQNEGFLPVTKSELVCGNSSKKIVRSEYNTSILTTVSSVQTKPTLAVTSKVNGIDLPDNTTFSNPSGLITPHKGQQVRLVKKVGQTITVAKRPVPLRGNESISSRVKLPATPSNVGGMTLSHPIKTVPGQRLPATYNIPYYKKLEPVTVSSQSKKSKTLRMVNSTKAKGSVIQASSPFPGSKLSGSEDTVLKKLLEVLNSKNMNMQEQLSLLQSMGVSIVQTPVASTSDSMKKNLEVNVDGTGAVSGKSGLPELESIFVTQPTSSVNSSASASKTCGNEEKSMDYSQLLINQRHPSKKVMSPSPASGKGNKDLPKAGQKRKQKQNDEKPVKRVKPAAKTRAGGMVSGAGKKNYSTKPQSYRCKQKERNCGEQRQLSFLTANDRPRLLTMPSASSPFKRFISHMNEMTLFQNDLFTDKTVEVERDVSRGDKGKALKLRLLRKHARTRHKRNKKTCVNYEKCLEDLDSTDLLKTFSAAKHFARVFSGGKRTRKAVHHERVLEKLYAPSEPVDPSYSLTSDCDISTFDSTGDGTVAFTLDTLLMKAKCATLTKQFVLEEHKLDLLSRCFTEDPNLAMKTVSSFVGGESVHRPGRSESSFKLPLCQLSSDEGLRCSKRALPYTNYCKEHIWHCETQCLYKLDQNMKTAADINPEPLVKRVRKRAKLLPLVKKYKKKRKKKVEASDLDETKGGSGQNEIPKSKVSYDGTNVSRDGVQNSLSTVSEILVSKSDRLYRNSDFDDSKRSDSSDEDLNLMTNEIMLSGVLDKLQNDAHDFDLFSEKNAEELERALLMAAASPTQDDQEDDHSSHASLPSEPLSSRPDSLPSFNSEMLLSPRLNSSPDAIINCDAPKSAEPPPALEQFNESQIAHYTFGSSVGAVVKKECQTESYPVEEVFPSEITAEYLQDIEGVLERLDAEGANSPKLPSSPAIDQYTSMLARQLSQEVEGETLKREAASTTTAQSISQPFKNPPSQSISTSFSLPSSIISSASSPLGRNRSPMQYCGVSTSNSVALSSGVPFKKPSALSSGNRVAVSQTIEVKNAVPLPHEMLPTSQRNVLTTKAVNALTMGMQYNRTAVTANASSVESKMKTTKSIPSANLRISGTGVSRLAQGKVQQTGSAGVVQNQMVPFTLMQTQQSQTGNVIKVIVPPGTIINGANGQQNMLLIPVSALVKSNLQAGNQNVLTSPTHPNASQGGSTVNVKPHLNSLPAGQQFFIVNNASAGTSQTHLALVQKPGNANTQQNILLKSQGSGIKDTTTYVRRQLNQDRKPISSVKSALNMQLKCGNIRSEQNARATTFAISSSMPSVVNNVNTQSLLSGKVTKVVAAQAGKMTAARNQGGRRKGKNTPRKPKARFDPITRKYVPITDPPVSTSVATVPSTIASQPVANRTESLIKFNESALSIQNKVLQIDSVLSSLNAAKSQGTSVKIQQELTRSKATLHPPKALMNHGSNDALNTYGLLKSTTAKPAVVTPSAVLQTKAIVSPSTVLSSSLQNDKFPSTSGIMLKQMQKNVPVVSSTTKSESVIEQPSISVNKDASLTPVSPRVSTATVGSGTVHWNQTTTAGPEISTTTLTVPVYITGAIPASAWGGELTLARSLNTTSLPVILPTRKTGGNGQIAQRVLLGSLGSAGLTRVSTVSSSSASLLKHSLISVPHSVVAMPKAKVSTVSSLKSFPNRNNRSVSVSHAETPTQLGEMIIKSPTSKSASSTLSGSAAALFATSKAALVAVSKHSLANDDSVLRKKSARKASHDTILHDSLISDPKVLDQNSSS